MAIYLRSILRTRSQRFSLRAICLKLAATVSAIDYELDACSDVGILDWNRRALKFLTILCRARHSTTDEGFKSIFAETGAPASVIHPIKIGKAIKQLASCNGFKSAVWAYNKLSNFCGYDPELPGSAIRVHRFDLHCQDSLVVRAFGSGFALLQPTPLSDRISSAIFS